MNRADRHKEAAKKVEDKLRAEGRAFDADQIRHLRMSLSGAQRTLSDLHRDNMELRNELARIAAQNGERA